MMPIRSLAAAVLLAAATSTAGAQQWRTVDVSRQLRDTSAHDVRIRYGIGTLAVRPTADPLLFAMHLRYDEESVAPVHQYDADSRTLTLGVSDASVRIGGGKRRSEGELRLALSRQVPMNLDVELGAAMARLDLGGLAVRELHLESGAAESKVDFAAPNPERMHLLDVSAGAASVELTGLANANVARVRVRGGAGSVRLDFAGTLERDVTVDAEMALGSVEIRVPRDAGVRVEVSRFLAGFDHPGLEKRGDAWYSANWDTAPRRMRLGVKTVFGSIRITRAD
jgi:hypothetical protein